MIHLLKVIYVVACVILLFGAAVFVHEFGHFWMARRRGLKVEAFAIGFGPKIFGWKKDGIDYSWRWIPAGGFVKLPQMITSEALEGTNDTPVEKLPPVTPWSKILVSVAGPFMNVVFAFVIATVLYFTGIPISVSPSFIGYVDPKSPEAAMGIQEGDRIVSVDNQSVTSWEEVQKCTVLARTNVLPVIIERDGVRKTYHLAAKVNETIGGKFLNLDPRDHAEVEGVNDGTAAAAAGLKAGDEILSVDKMPVYGQQRFVELIQGHAGQPAEIVVLRDKQKLALTVTPIADPTTHKGRIGAMIGSSSEMRYQVQRPGPAPWVQIESKLDATISTFLALLHSKQTGVGAKDLTGPVGIFAMLAGWVYTDYRLALDFLVLLNVNLAIVNLLPLPVLDGGHIAMSLIEWVRRRPLNVRFVEYATMLFAFLLISFFLYISAADVKRLPLLRTMFNGKTVIEQPGTNSDNGPDK
jgi:regulator of sigma E protease